MEVQILESMVGDSFAWLAGDIVTVSPAEAAQMVTAGVAIPVERGEPETPEGKQPKRSKR
jgi:hypothetical protein